MPKHGRTRTVTSAQARAYVRKAEEYREAAAFELEARRAIAATSLAIHAGINAADAVCALRLGHRAAGQDHDEVLALLKTAGSDGVAVANDLSRLLPMKTRAEYEPDEIPVADARKAVERQAGSSWSPNASPQHSGSPRPSEARSSSQDSPRSPADATSGIAGGTHSPNQHA